MNHFIGTLHCSCEVITLALISLGNLTHAPRTIAIDLPNTDYSNSSWEVDCEHLWQKNTQARTISVICLLSDRLDLTSSDVIWSGVVSAVCRRQCGFSMGS